MNNSALAAPLQLPLCLLDQHPSSVATPRHRIVLPSRNSFRNWQANTLDTRPVLLPWRQSAYHSKRYATGKDGCGVSTVIDSLYHNVMTVPGVEKKPNEILPQALDI